MTTRSRKVAKADAAGDDHPLPEISLTKHTTCVDLNLTRQMMCKDCIKRSSTKRQKKEANQLMLRKVYI